MIYQKLIYKKSELNGCGVIKFQGIFHLQTSLPQHPQVYIYCHNFNYVFQYIDSDDASFSTFYSQISVAYLNVAHHQLNNMLNMKQKTKIVLVKHTPYTQCKMRSHIKLRSLQRKCAPKKLCVRPTSDYQKKKRAKCSWNALQTIIPLSDITHHLPTNHHYQPQPTTTHPALSRLS